MGSSIYDVLGCEGYSLLFPDHLAAAEQDVKTWYQKVERLGLSLGGRLLDIGCGLGERTAAWANYGYEVMGIDKSRPMIAEAQKRFPHLDLREWDAGECSPLGSFSLVVAHFNFLMMMDMLRVQTLFDDLHRCIPNGGAFLTDFCRPLRRPEGFREQWILNGRAFTEIGTPLADGYEHRWFEGMNLVCEERFWFRERETYRRVAESMGWSAHFLDWKVSDSGAHDLAVFVKKS
ncbi:MAG: hypothetical protein RL141_376 [Candidatus Parcubacteria bacterium]|jgi:cyclopropane fatty-acyl-phospholipid synthase-like methyltransferase